MQFYRIWSHCTQLSTYVGRYYLSLPIFKFIFIDAFQSSHLERISPFLLNSFSFQLISFSFFLGLLSLHLSHFFFCLFISLFTLTQSTYLPKRTLDNKNKNYSHVTDLLLLLLPPPSLPLSLSLLSAAFMKLFPSRRYSKT